MLSVGGSSVEEQATVIGDRIDCLHDLSLTLDAGNEMQILRYIKDWVTRVHAMIDGRGQIDYSIVPNSRLRLIFKYKT